MRSHPPRDAVLASLGIALAFAGPASAGAARLAAPPVGTAAANCGSFTPVGVVNNVVTKSLTCDAARRVIRAWAHAVNSCAPINGGARTRSCVVVGYRCTATHYLRRASSHARCTRGGARVRFDADD